MKRTFLSKPLSYALASIAIFSTLLTSCKKKEEETPAPVAQAKVFTSVVSQGSVASGLADVTGTVTITDGIAYLKLIGTSSETIDHVYITKAEDNGSMSGYVPTENYTDDKKNTFTAGGTSGASYKVGNTKDFTLIIPVSIRTTTAAVSDVYRIWFTNGAGAFTLPAKNLKLGPVTFTLNYVANPTASFTTNTGVQLGDQYAAPGSLLVTSGQVSALGTASYNDSPNSADLALCELKSDGSARTGATPTYTGGVQGSGSLWFVSPSERAALGYQNEPTTPAIPNITYISENTTIDFNTVNGKILQDLSVGTGTKVKLANGGVYQFVTASGNKGLIKVTSLTATTAGAGGTATVSVKVLN